MGTAQLDKLEEVKSPPIENLQQAWIGTLRRRSQTDVESRRSVSVRLETSEIRQEDRIEDLISSIEELLNDELDLDSRSLRSTTLDSSEYIDEQPGSRLEATIISQGDIQDTESENPEIADLGIYEDILQASVPIR